MRKRETKERQKGIRHERKHGKLSKAEREGKQEETGKKTKKKLRNGKEEKNEISKRE